MKPRHQVSKDAIELIKRFEGYRRASAALGDGRYTIGYGHTKTARPGVEIDERDAEALLRYDLIPVVAAVNELTFTPLTQNQFDALVCFAANIGIENFRRSSALRRVNEGNLLQAAAAIEMWRKSEFEGEKIIIDALIRRRAAEKSLFLLPPEGYVPAPSPVLPPRIDYDTASQTREPAVRMVVALDGDTAVAVPEEVETPATPPESASPIAVAADVVSAKLQSIVPDEIQTQIEDEPVEGPAVEEVVAPVAVLEAEPPVPVPVPVPVAPEAPEPVAVEAEVVEEAEVQPAPAPRPVMDFTLTPPPIDFTRVTEPEPVAEPAAEPESEPLPFDAPPPVVVRNPEPLAPPPPPPSFQESFPERSTSIAANADLSRRLVASDEPFAPDFSPFGEDVKPMKFNLAPLFILGGVGLVSFAFAIVWGLSTGGAGGGLFGPLAVSWATGILGIGCMVASFYMLVNRLGGPEE